jgi:hypothetical protein
MGDSVNRNESLDSPTVLLRRLHRWRMAFFGLAILLAGVMTGVAATLLTLHYMGPKPPPGPEVLSEAILHRIAPRLQLSPEQVEQIKPILHKYMQKLDEIREAGRGEILKQLRLMNAEISGVLKEDQERMWQELMRGLPGQVPHGPWRRGPGFGPGPGPGGGPFGPRPDRPGPRRTFPDSLPAPDANATQDN